LLTKFLTSRRSILAALPLMLFALWPVPRLAACCQEKLDFADLERVALAELKETGAPGAAVAVVIGDRVVYSKALGVANVETGAPLSADMLFRLGSTTKMMTAAALNVLADRGRIKLDAPIGNYVKGLNPKIARVSAHQLLSNTSGIRDFAAPIVSNDEDALGRSVLSWKDDVFFTEPGEVYSYSSPGYWLAGYVLEQVGGKPYAEMMDELLFKPAGMNRTTLRPLVAMTYPMALAHNVEANGRASVIRPFFNNTAMWPAGSVFSNVTDLSRFVIALMNDGRIEGKQSFSQSLAARLSAQCVALPGEKETYYGYGLLSFKDRGVRVVMHGGFSRGYGSMIQMEPEGRFAIVVLTNKSGETLAKTRAKAMELALQLKPAEQEGPPRALPMTGEEMASYVGVYSHHPQTWEILVREGKLFIKDQDGETEMTKIGEHKFSVGEAGEIALVPGREGRAEYLFNGLYSARRRRPEK
jgi:CubicO group peptidase (beta-lactamase class C family)